MDIPRPSQARARLKRRILFGVALGLGGAGITIVLARLKPAAPTVERSSVWIDTVKRGPMIRQVRGIGTLVPEEIRWVAARTQGRVDRVLLRPGDQVQPDSVILVLINPDVEQAAANAESQLDAAEAERLSLAVKLRGDVLSVQSSAAGAKADFEQTRIRAEVNEKLFQQGLATELDLRLTRINAETSAARHSVEQQRLVFVQESIAPQLAVKEAEVKRLRAQARLRRDDVSALSVRAGMRGVLQVLPVEIGAQVQPGANLARVADSTRLRAEIRVAETQAKDVQVNQVAQIDTRNGLVPGRVARVDPSVTQEETERAEQDRCASSVSSATSCKKSGV